MILITSHICERCETQFQRPGQRKYRFCSQMCANQHALKLTADQLKPYAEAGTPNGIACMELQVSPRTFRDALISYGLYRGWATRRFKKCAVAA